MRILIYGCTRLTDALAPVLIQDGHHVTVMDADADRLAILSKQTEVTTVWVAEPLIQDYLLQGEFSTADAFFILTNEDHKNLLLSQIATHIYNVPKVMCRITDPQLHDLYQPLGITILDSGPDFLSSAREFLDKSGPQ